MIGYARLNRQLSSGLGFVEIISTALNAAAQGWNAYTEYQHLEQQEDALKLKKREFAAAQAALADAKREAEQQAQAALIADREAASAGIAAAAAQEVPMWAWAAGAVALGGVAIFFLRKKGKKR